MGFFSERCRRLPGIVLVGVRSGELQITLKENTLVTSQSVMYGPTEVPVADVLNGNKLKQLLHIA